MCERMLHRWHKLCKNTSAHYSGLKFLHNSLFGSRNRLAIRTTTLTGQAIGISTSSTSISQRSRSWSLEPVLTWLPTLTSTKEKIMKTLDYHPTLWSICLLVAIVLTFGLTMPLGAQENSTEVTTPSSDYDSLIEAAKNFGIPSVYLLKHAAPTLWPGRRRGF